MSKYIHKLNISPLSGNGPKVFPYLCVQKDMHVCECEWSDEGWGWFLGLEKRCLSPMLNLPYAFPRSEVFTPSSTPRLQPPVSTFVEMRTVTLQ